jgi:phosphate starvation-inducible protein PhoH and related proteins
LAQAMRLLDGIQGVSIMMLTAEDVVRHRLVKEIVKAYERADHEERMRRDAADAAKEANAVTDGPRNAASDTE